MPKIIDVRRRIFELVINAPNQTVSRASLWDTIGLSYRPMMDEQISDMLSTGILVQVGLGIRGMPIKYVLGARFPLPKCPLCESEISPVTHPKLFAKFKKYLTKPDKGVSSDNGGDNDGSHLVPEQ